METAVEIPNISIHTATSEGELVKVLADQINRSFKNKDLVFQPAHIIAPNRAQFQWIKEELAKELGFIANLEYHNLNSFFNDLIKKLKPEPGELPGNEKLIWQLFTELGKADFRENFPKIAEYCGEDEIKRLALAQKLADLFQDYQEYKPKLILKWINGEYYNPEREDEKWQAYLFKAAGFDKKFVHPKEFMELVKQNPGIIKEVGFLFLYGELSFTPLQLEYLKILKDSERLTIKIYQPRLNLKGENNPLAKNWGKIAELKKMQFKELAEISGTEDPDCSRETLLAGIQNDILKDKSSTCLTKDDSLLIYNSFTKVREVEALYNYLVKTVDEADEQLGARDIAVYMPNLDPYIPAIKTVFDSAPHKLPYTLVSRGFSREESFWTALEQVLSFEEEDFTAPKVFNLIEMEPIRISFGFSDLDLIRKAFTDANIRREYEGDEDLETHYASFCYGLQRLIYGFCLGDETPVEIGDEKIWPVDIAEGQQAQDIFRLHHLVELLNELVQKKKTKRTASDWHRELELIAKQFMNPEQWHEKQFASLMENLVSLKDSEEMIAFNTFFHRLKDHLQNKDLQQFKGQGGIVFSGLYPGISLPKKVVAFLGLNFQEFPRKSQKLSFDLLEEDDKPGSRAQDRGAFLQAFLNAEKKVLLSYIGQNVKDNSEIPASSIISELNDYVEKGGVKLTEVKHKLHGFSNVYFGDADPYFYTYNGIEKRFNPNDGNKTAIKPVLPDTLPLFHLEGFLKDPFKHHYNKVLGIYYEDQENLPEWECFELDKLQEWIVKDDLKERRLVEGSFDLEEMRRYMLLKSKIPLKNTGKNELTKFDDKVEDLLKKLGEISNGESITKLEKTFSCCLKSGKQINLDIKLDCLGEDLLFLNVSKKDNKGNIKLKYKISALIQGLALKALGYSGIIHFLCLDSDGNPSYENFEIRKSVAEALEELKYFLDLYESNLQKIVPFYPELKLETEDLKECDKGIKEEKTVAVATLIDDVLNGYQTIYASDAFMNEYRLGFFDLVKGEENILRLHQLTIDINEKIDNLFNNQKQ